VKTLGIQFKLNFWLMKWLACIEVQNCLKINKQAWISMNGSLDFSLFKMYKWWLKLGGVYGVLVVLDMEINALEKGINNGMTNYEVLSKLVKLLIRELWGKSRKITLINWLNYTVSIFYELMVIK